jgi:asparagine synthase (glutamine-hydrolysing)
MCGIAGIISKNTAATQRIQPATATLAHRGPEDEGFWYHAAGTAALGHKRLCIIDLNPRSKQPFSYLHRYHIVHNGELYNYLELKTELEKQGHRFTTASDTEVIAAAYHAYGAQCLQHFDGMYAFAIWDEQEQTLFAARDRFGEKPFFFYYDEEQLVFASEMKALWAAGIPKEVNERMLYNYLTIGYTSNPCNPQETFYENISRLPAASYLHYSFATHQLAIEKYWQMAVEETINLSDDHAIEQFTALLSESVKKRLRSDVAIGTSLSGGLDSSTIVAVCSGLAAEHYAHQCFTAAFPGFDKNEAPYASAVARQFHLQHHLVNIDGQDLTEEMDQLMYHQEEPVGSASVMAQYKVYQAAKQNGITVLLDGQGADEILAGYHKYYKWYWQELYQQKKLKQSGELKEARALNIQEAFGWKNKATALFPHFALAMLQSGKARNAFNQPYLNRDFASGHKRDLYYTLPAQPNLNGALYFNTFVYGLEELLRYADRNSMAHAVEVRLPFLQHQLAEFLFSLPPRFKIRRGWSKWLLRKAAAPLLPVDIVWRKDKVGFEPPQKQWMSTPRVQEAVQESKRLLVSQNILSKDVLKQPVVATDAFAANNTDWRFWSASYLFL